MLYCTLIPSHCIQVDNERLSCSLAVKLDNFKVPKIDTKVTNSSTNCLISVKIAILTPHIIPTPLVNIWLVFICGYRARVWPLKMDPKLGFWVDSKSHPKLARYNWPHSFSCAARCGKRQISCHNKRYIQSRPRTGEVQTRHEY